jgi:hypothetical protein
MQTMRVPVGRVPQIKHMSERRKIPFCAILLYLLVYHVCFQDGKLCLLVANDKLDSK